MITLRKNFSGIQGIIDLMGNDITFVEIGVYVGDATKYFLNSGKIKKYYAIDPWENDYDDRDSLSNNANMSLAEKTFDKNIKTYKDIIIKLKMKSEQAINHINEKVDVVYIDGIHTYDGVRNDIINYLPLIKYGGIISGHDYNNTWKSVMKSVNDTLGKPEYTYEDGSWVIFKKDNMLK